MDKIKDLLVFTAVYRLEPETVLGLFSLEYDGALSFLLQRDNPFRRGDGSNDGLANHWSQYVRGRRLFLDGSYDAMLIIESDIVPPPDTISRLEALQADVAYGTYVFRNNRSPVVNIFERYPSPARNVGESLSVRGLWRSAYEHGIIECSGGGLGCVLIRRPVLEDVGFTLGPGTAFCDSPWTWNVYRAGYTMKADTRLLCAHIDEDGSYLFPPIPEAGG